MTAIEFRSKGSSYKLIEFERLSIRQSSIKNLFPVTETPYLSLLDQSIINTLAPRIFRSLS